MSVPVYECIPNFSTGRDPQLITCLMEAVQQAGVPVLNVHSDPDYNRTVLTFMGVPDRVADASFRAIACAADRIDMTRHVGAHPRLGATDVCPWVALDAEQEAQCVTALRKLAARVADELDLCVYLYGKAALRPERRRLSDIRRGEFEVWYRDVVTDPRWCPDLGPRTPRVCGPVVLGVRPLLIAINYVLDAPDLATARHIARQVRRPDLVQARGFRIGDDVHVSCNLLDYHTVNPRQVFDRVQQLARRAGTEVRVTEIVGMVPSAALDLDDVRTMRVRSFSEHMVLDHWMPE